MFWKIVGTLGALSFILGALDILNTPGCDQIIFGGTARSSTYSCTFGYTEGQMSAQGAAALMIGGGFLLLYLVWRPLINGLVGNRIGAYTEDDDSRTAEDQILRNQWLASLPLSPDTREGWHIDPAQVHPYRYFNGSQWTDRVSDERFNSDVAEELAEIRTSQIQPENQVEGSSKIIQIEDPTQIVTALTELESLYARGSLSEAEYSAAKSRILGI